MSARTFPLDRYYKYMFLPGLIFFLAPGIITSYLLMPFPGSQEQDLVGTIHALEPWVLPLRILGLLLMILPVIDAFVNGGWAKRIFTGLLVLFCGFLTFVMTQFVKAEVMFQEPTQLIFKDAGSNDISKESLVIGVEHEGEAKAYPINLIAYHHKVQDTIGSLPMLVTYCSMCRTGEVFRPEVDGKHLTFRLVGANYYNAMIEDDATGSWWFQATGEAVVGPMKGKKLPIIPSEQTTLAAWLEKHPKSLVMQRDPAAAAGYAGTENYDYRRPNDSSWTPASWVIGVSLNDESKAYPWAPLVRARVINDRVGSTPVVLAVQKDTASFHVWNRTVDGETLDFALDSTGTNLRDTQSGSIWDWNGVALSGRFAGKKLGHVQASQEYWHAWKRFQPGTGRWESI